MKILFSMLILFAIPGTFPAWGSEISGATPVEKIKIVDGFKVELLFSVPKEEFGSWVAMTLDDKQRLIVSDQYGALCRFPIPGPGETMAASALEKIDLDIGGAQGLLYAFDSLYAVLNTKEHGGAGLYRLTDTDGDDHFDKKELLRQLECSGGEHGPHAVILGPDQKSIYVVAGNQTKTTQFATSRVPLAWGEDILLERPIGRGFMKGVLAPGGWIARTDPYGKNWELIATGFRNEYDAAFNREGQLFTYDADMEWDMNTPWYRPTRINHVISGAEFGWRSGGAKWPDYYTDSVGAVVNIGPGSPTGVTFGYGAKFPKKYQDAFYAFDWSYGKLYAIHMKPEGSSYTGEIEEFMSAQPLPLTDVVINPKDGAMYLAIGGRRVQSGLYRVTYAGKEPVGNDSPEPLNELAKLRLELETLHRPDPKALDIAWPCLSHPDRYIRFAARIAVEHQPVDTWRDRVLAEKSADGVIQSSIALARHGTKADLEPICEHLLLGWHKLSDRQRLDQIRAYTVLFSRFGDGEGKKLSNKVTSFLSAYIPFENSPALNNEMLQLMVYAQDPAAAEYGIDLLASAPSQEEQMGYVKSIRHLKQGWTRELRTALFKWFTRAGSYRGGASFELFIKDLKETALANTPEAEKLALKDIIEAEPPKKQLFTAEARSFVKNWVVGDLDDVINVGLEGNRNFANGRKMFGAGMCFSCHRFNQEGGALGPDLTSVSGKFSPRDLLEQISDPGKEISDQYGQMIFTRTDGSVVIGRIMNMNDSDISINTDMMNPNAITQVNRGDIATMEASPISMMPPGLLNTMNKDDILDLLAYLLSKGNPKDVLFSK